MRLEPLLLTPSQVWQKICNLVHVIKFRIFLDESIVGGKQKEVVTASWQCKIDINKEIATCPSTPKKHSSRWLIILSQSDQKVMLAIILLILEINPHHLLVQSVKQISSIHRQRIGADLYCSWQIESYDAIFRAKTFIYIYIFLMEIWSYMEREIFAFNVRNTTFSPTCLLA